MAPSAERRAQAEASLTELGHLAQSAGARVAGSLLQVRSRPDPATLIGSGKVRDLKHACDTSGADLVLFDDNLTPAQQRNLEGAVARKTLDRTQLILDIFARRAHTREGRLQVELAQLDYLLPRLTGHGVLLSRLGGGIGTRGPGETKLETDRRRIRRRIQSARREIEEIRRRRRTNREARSRAALPVVALVGYTNAGKSTLFGALTRSQPAVSDQLFMTLDPLIRRSRLGDGRDVLLVDTVGFIQKLPHQLVAAFRATLEEVVGADLLLHVMDASADDRDRREAAVRSVLEELGAADRPCLRVLNQVDRLDASRVTGLAAAEPEALLVSARTGVGLDRLRERMAERLGLTMRSVSFRLGVADREVISFLYRVGRVRSHEVHGDEVHIDALVQPWVEERLGEYAL